MMQPADVYLIKAVASLVGAESEFANGRYDNCANRCYYAVFQAAIAALTHAGLTAERGGRTWDHGFVQAEFIGRLINRQRSTRLVCVRHCPKTVSCGTGPITRLSW